MGRFVAKETDVRWLEILIDKFLIRADLNTSSRILGIRLKGDMIQVLRQNVVDDQGREWAELTPSEAWLSCSDHDGRAFALIDGCSLGLGLLLREVAREEWPGPDRAEQSGLYYKVGLGMRPSTKSRYLCQWMSDAPTSCAMASPYRPRVCVATMLKGAHPEAVRTWILYHLRLQMSCLWLFFDDPEDEAIPVAEELAGITKNVVIHRLSESWWQSAKARSRFYEFRKHNWADEVVKMHESIQDVQSRQQLCIDIALQDAFSAGMHWLLHIDIDELLYLPERDFRMDAPAWFARANPDVDVLRFHNHECVPDSFDVVDWFREVTLFKVHCRFLRHPEDPAEMWNTPSNSEDEYSSSDEESQSESRSRCKKKKSWMDVAWHRELFPVQMQRSRLTRELDLQLPEPEPRNRRKKKGHSTKSKSAHRSEADDKRFAETFTHFLGYSNGKCAVRLQSRSLDAGHPLYRCRAPPVPAGVHFFNGLDNNGCMKTLECIKVEGCSAPVILHYANCGYAYWVSKYLNLGNFPDKIFGKQNTMRAHLAARNLALRGDPKKLEHFYKLFVMGNELGELPVLFSLGLIIRIDGVQRIVEEARAEMEVPSVSNAVSALDRGVARSQRMQTKVR